MTSDHYSSRHAAYHSGLRPHSPSNLSTAVMLYVTSLVLMFIGRVRFLNLIRFVGIAVGALFLFICVLLLLPKEKQGRLENGSTGLRHSRAAGMKRIRSPSRKIAVASGGIFGKMPGNSTQRISFASVFRLYFRDHPGRIRAAWRCICGAALHDTLIPGSQDSY